MAVKRLRDYGLQSERLLWPTKGPGVFEQELAADELESKLGLTTLAKAPSRSGRGSASVVMATSSPWITLTVPKRF